MKPVVAVTLAWAVFGAAIPGIPGCGKEDSSRSAPPGDQVGGAYLQAQVDSARLGLAEVAQSAYPLWAINHPDDDCPGSLDDLVPYLAGARKLVDPWGNPLTMACRARPPGEHRFGVISAGPDGKPGTADDLHSWDQATEELGRWPDEPQAAP
jgi:hypothetical protein